jgi:membrane-associated phospholipid phosphatase
MLAPALALLAALPGEAEAGVYRLVPELDLPAIAVAGTISVGWLLRGLTPPAWCAPRCDPAALPSFDRGAAGNYDPGFATASDLGVAGLVGGSLVLLGALEGLGPGLRDGVVVLESALTGVSLSVLTTAAVRRPRPLEYGDQAPLSERNSGNGALSFFSGHSAASFATAVALWRTVERADGDGPLPWIVLGVGLAAATAVAVSRVEAGQHFPSDVLAGAIVGTAAGFAVPALHVPNAPPIALGPTAGGASLRVAF